MTADAQVSPETGPPSRPPGRPRSQTAHRAILDAAFELFAEAGFDAMSIEGVAARAGVGKATIYRRWPSKEELVAEAMASLVAEEVDVPDTGSVRDDLLATLRNLIRFMTGTRAGTVFPQMVVEVAQGTPLGRRYVETVVNPRRAMGAGVVRRAVLRGELRPDLDVEVAVDALFGQVLLHRLLGDLERLPSDAPETMLRTVLDGWWEGGGPGG